MSTVAVTPAADTILALGVTRQFTAVAKDASGNTISGKSFTWQSSAPAVLSVDPATGVATAVANGTATITASVDGKTGQAAVTVAQDVATVSVTPGSASVTALGATQQFTAAAKDANNNAVTGARFVWLSSNHAVATVDSTGLARAVGPGSVTITAAARGIPGAATFTVTQAPKKLAFSVQPTSTTVEGTLSPVIQVEIQDSTGTRVAGARNAVTLSIGTNPGGATLTGSLTGNAVDGIASFGGINIAKPGLGYTLVAAAGGLAQATSASFDVTLGLVALGEGATCAMSGSGATYCWGFNHTGQVGDGTALGRNVPTRVSGGLSFTTVSGSGDHTCAATSGGVGYCWGFGANGQLGNGQTLTQYVPVLTYPNGADFGAMTAGGASSCDLTSTGAASCWGQNTTGQLGIGTTTPESVPWGVSGGLTFATISAGNIHTCGVTTGSALYCWGGNYKGELGNNSTKLDSVPVLISLNFTAVTSGTEFTCGIATGGTAYCWGDNTYGQLGRGTTGGLDSVPGAVSGGLTFASLSAGALGRHVCGITTGGATYCWGSNGQGRLGDGTTTDRNTPTLVVGGHTFAQVRAGGYFTCGITTSKQVYCWGSNNQGSLGDGTMTDSSVPVRVKGG